MFLLMGAGAGCGKCGDPPPTPGRESGGQAAATRSSPTEGGPGGPRFESERVELTLSAGRMQVLGIYTFGNPAPRLWRGRIGYPILVDKGQRPPQRVLVDKGEELTVRCRAPERCAAVVALDLPPTESRTIRLRYEQRLTGRRAAYLLTSARRWKRPLRRADFVIRVPVAWKGVNLSYPPDQDTVRGSLRILRFSRRDFVPAKELVVTWVE